MTLVLDTLMTGILTGAAVMSATELTYRSELFSPIRRQFLRLGVWGTNGRPDEFSTPLIEAFRASARFVARFVSDAFLCPFCSSWWHALWIVSLVCLVTNETWHDCWRTAVAAYLPAVAVAKVMHDKLTTHHPKVRSEAPTSIFDALRDAS